MTAFQSGSDLASRFKIFTASPHPLSIARESLLRPSSPATSRALTTLYGRRSVGSSASHERLARLQASRVSPAARPGPCRWLVRPYHCPAPTIPWSRDFLQRGQAHRGSQFPDKQVQGLTRETIAASLRVPIDLETLAELVSRRNPTIASNSKSPGAADHKLPRSLISTAMNCRVNRVVMILGFAVTDRLRERNDAAQLLRTDPARL